MKTYPISRPALGAFDRLKEFGRDDRGVTAIEYGLIAAGVFLGIVGPVKVIADKMNITYTNILNYFNSI